jgi:hypothetical protein
MPAWLSGDRLGLTVTTHGPLVTRLWRVMPRAIPWSDVAGASACLRATGASPAGSRCWR